MTLEKLNSYRNLQRDIRLDLEKKKALEIEAYNAGAASMSGMPRSGGKKTSKTERYAIQLAELQKKIDDQLMDKIGLEAEIRDFIETQDAYTRTILKMRFEQGRTWAAVGAMAHITDEGARKMVYRCIIASQKGGK